MNPFVGAGQGDAGYGLFGFLIFQLIVVLLKGLMLLMAFKLNLV